MRYGVIAHPFILALHYLNLLLGSGNFRGAKMRNFPDHFCWAIISLRSSTSFHIFYFYFFISSLFFLVPTSCLLPHKLIKCKSGNLLIKDFPLLIFPLNLCSVLNGEESVDSIHFGSTIPGALEVQSFSLIDKIILVSKFMLTYFLGCFWQFCYTAFHGKWACTAGRTIANRTIQHWSANWEL